MREDPLADLLALEKVAFVTDGVVYLTNDNASVQLRVDTRSSERGSCRAREVGDA